MKRTITRRIVPLAAITCALIALGGCHHSHVSYGFGYGSGYCGDDAYGTYGYVNSGGWGGHRWHGGGHGNGHGHGHCE
jgi:hypothetical protein